ncbi:hypothetical protein TWF506_000248 [Arthrobotrys conoides]|uniref:C2H2-type domain-containing protein n=1 Tax=Arthrobotrys conoides TaxID=74498 RepID=A0AAN8NDI1_9PEZI
MAFGKSYKHFVPSGQDQGIFGRFWRAYNDQAAPTDCSQRPDISENRQDNIDRSGVAAAEREVLSTSPPKVFQCSGCSYNSKHKATLERHVETKHNAARQLHLCRVRSCKRFTKGFSRPDNLARHIKSRHPEEIKTQNNVTTRYIDNRSPYQLSSNPDSSPEGSPQDSVPYESNTPFSEMDDDWCLINDSSWEVSPSIEEVGFQREGGYEDLGGPNAYVVKQPLTRISISDLRGLLQLAGEDALIQLPDEPSPRKGDDIKNTIKKVLQAKEDAQAIATLASQLPLSSPGSRYTVPCSTPRQAFELLDQKIRETMEPSKNKRINQHRVLHLYEKFLEEAHNSYLKLIDATEDPANMRSPALKDFISSLVNVENIITTGCAALSNFLDRKVPKDLKSIYCMLHVSYSMSHSTTVSQSPQITDTQFSESAATWKEWLPEISDSGVREQDVFEELLEIMWSEMKEGLENITEWFDKHLNREMAIIEEETDPNLPTAGVFQDADPLYPGVCDSLFPDLAENDQNTDSIPPDLNTMDEVTPEEVRPSCDADFLSTSTDLEPPPWESLSESLVITAASSFLRELESSGILFLDLFGTLGTLFANRAYGDEDISQSTGCFDPIQSDSQERQKVVTSMKSALDYHTYPQASPVVSTVSDLFLKGYLAGLEDLEECTVFFLKILCKPSHSVLTFFSAIVAHFSEYYHHQLPARAKCSHDRYKNACYVSSRFKEAAGFVRSAHRSGSTTTSSPKTDVTSPNTPDLQAPPMCSRKRDNKQAGVDERKTISGKRSKLDMETIQDGNNQRVFTFKFETGNPATRKKHKQFPNLHTV